jgi:uncharacterized protein YeaO (DUF488 family)
MPGITTKSLAEPIDHARDGLRILASRFRGHRVAKAQYDVWMASLGPSDPLLAKFREGAFTWAQFRSQYRREMLQGFGYEEPNHTLRNCGQKFTIRLLKRVAETQSVTLLCHCGEEVEHCHRHVLKELIEAAEL